VLFIFFFVPGSCFIRAACTIVNQRNGKRIPNLKLVGHYPKYIWQLFREEKEAKPSCS